MMRRLTIPAGVLLAAALVAAGCGSSSKSSSSKATSTTSSSSSAATATTVSSKSTPLGAVLVDASGRTLYLFEKDKAGQSSCSGACANAWPPVIAGGAPSAGSGVSSAKLTSITRADGTKQVAYNGHALYRFTGDTSAGELKGQNVHAFGADWYVISTSGEKVDKPAPKTGGSSSSGGGAGY